MECIFEKASKLMKNDYSELKNLIVPYFLHIILVVISL